MSQVSAAPLLLLDSVHAHYGKSHILRGVSLQVAAGEVVSLLGRNGSGRSTTLKSIMGLVPPSAGRVQLGNQELQGQRVHAICRAGVAYVPEEREVFANLTVEENLRMGVQDRGPRPYRWSIDEMFQYFPGLSRRRSTKAGCLSGGEQQMLTICRSLLGNPLLILVDEPTEGLAPKIVDAVREVIEDVRRKGVSVLLVEQKLAIALRVSSRVCVMGHGTIVFEGTPDELQRNDQLLAEWLAV